MILGSIEAGGTKFVCATSDKEFNILKRIEFPTTSVEETFGNVIQFFTDNPVDALGVGSFGPIDLDASSKTYGYITNTPKPGWKDTNFIGILSVLDIPVYWTTDVNAAAYGEYINDDAINSCLYFTIGTGVGGGFVNNGEVHNGFSHPEMGHMIVRKHPNDDFKGFCVFHGDCLEGLASGPTIHARTGIKGQDLPDDHEVFDHIASYIAQAAYNTTLVLSPDKIVLGGGVMSDKLLSKVKIEFTNIMQSYVETPVLEDYLTTPTLGNNAGTIGCLALAKKLLTNNN